MLKVGQYVRFKPEHTTDEGQRFVYVVQSMDDVHNTVTMVCINPMSSDNPAVTVRQDDVEKVWDDENVPSWVWIEKPYNGGMTLDTVFSEFYHEYIKPDETTVQYNDDSTTVCGDGAISGSRYLLTYDGNGEYIDSKTRKL